MCSSAKAWSSLLRLSRNAANEDIVAVSKRPEWNKVYIEALQEVL